MIIKRLIIAVGALTILVGLSQLVFPSWWVDVLPEIVESRWLAASGIVSILVGALLLIALAERLVFMRALFGVLGVLLLGIGALVILNPEMTRDLVDAFVLNRASGYQIGVVVVGGVIRTVIGVLLIWAIAKSPGRPDASRPTDIGD